MARNCRNLVSLVPRLKKRFNQLLNEENVFPILTKCQLKNAWEKFPSHPNSNREAAVLIPLVEFEDGSSSDNIHLVFTKRSSKMRSHPSEISFPGGGREPQDETLIETALRETQEELSIEVMRKNDWTIVGVCAPIPSLSGTPVTAVLGVYHPVLKSPEELDKFFPGSPCEVETVFTVSLSTLLDGESFEASGGRLGDPAPVYQVPNFSDVKIWGLTAYVLRPVLHRILKPVLFKSKSKK